MNHRINHHLRTFGCALFVTLLLWVQGCAPAQNEHRLVVFAASSLTNVFQDLKDSFEEENPGVTVQLSFAGSQTLRVQIDQGAPADIFASANLQHVAAVLEKSAAKEPIRFAHNGLVVVVPKDNPAKINAFLELARAKRIVIGTEQVPIGRYTRQALSRAVQDYGPGFQREVMSQVVSQETNVRLVLAKVRLGAADAAIVYRTDVIFDDVKAIEIPQEFNVRADYQMAALTAGPEGGVRDRWMQFMSSDQAKEILRRHRFAHD